MPKETRTSQGTGVGLQSTKTRQAGGVVASIRGQADTHSGIGGLAEGLKGVLDLGIDIGTDIRQDADERDAAQAEADSLRGVVDADRIRKSHAYESTLQRANLDRDVEKHSFELSNTIEEKISDGTLKTPTEVNAFIDDSYREFLQDDDGSLTDDYGALTNFGNAIPSMDKARTSMVASAFDQMEDVRDLEMAAVQADGLAGFYKRNGSFNLTDSLEVVPKGKRVALRGELVRKAMNVGIRNGDPDALTAMLKSRYTDGTPVLDAASEAMVINAINTAANREISINKANKVIAERKIENEILTLTLKGESIEEQLNAAVDGGLIDRAAATSLYNFDKSLQDDADEGAINVNSAQLFEQDIYLGDEPYEAMQARLISMTTAGELGDGKAVKREATRLLKLINDTKNKHLTVDKSVSSDAITRTTQQLKGTFLIEKSGGFFSAGGARPNKRQSAALARAIAQTHREFRELGEGALDPTKEKAIFDKAVEEHLSEWENMKVTASVVPVRSGNAQMDGETDEQYDAYLQSKVNP